MARRSRKIMHIIKRHGGKRLPKTDKWSPPRYEFSSSMDAARVVWEIMMETGRESTAVDGIVTVWT